MDFNEIIITVPAEHTELAGDIANMAVPYGIYVEDYRDLEQDVHEIAHIDLIEEDLLKKDKTKSLIHLYLDQGDNPAEAVAFLSERYTAVGIVHTIEVKQCLEEDWANNWKQYFHPIPVGERLLIRPVWEEEFDAAGRTVLHLEPGIAFGTGTHETTRLCLELLEQYLPQGGSMLDVGCGSGILAVAGLLLGAEKAVGVDIDEAAVRTARQNAALNGVEGRFTALCGNLTDKVSGQFDLIAANIVADVILSLTDSLTPFLRPETIYLVSGVIDTREEEVAAKLREGFDILEVRRDRGWCAMAARPKKR